LVEWRAHRDRWCGLDTPVATFFVESRGYSADEVSLVE
jgi:hypothetical protein